MDALEFSAENILLKPATSAHPTEDPINEDENTNIIILNTFTIMPELIGLDEEEDWQNIRNPNNIPKLPRNSNAKDSVIPKILKPSRQKSDYYQCKFCSESFSMLFLYLWKHFTTPNKELPNKCQEYFTAGIANGRMPALDTFCTKIADAPETEQISNNKEGDDDEVQILSVITKFNASLLEEFVSAGSEINENLEQSFRTEICPDDQQIENEKNIARKPKISDKVEVSTTKFRHLRLLKKPKIISPNPNTDKCYICNCEFASLKLLQNHALAVHNIEEESQNNVGLKAGKRFSKLQQQPKAQNEKQYSADSYRCNLCEETFSKNLNLKRHKLSAHGLSPFECEICSKTFSSVQYVNRHKLAVHEKFRYKCDSCQKEYTQLNNLKLHKRVAHKGYRYQCELCSKEFREMARLKEHQRAVHQGWRYECDLCPKVFSHSPGLSLHKSTAHRSSK